MLPAMHSPTVILQRVRVLILWSSILHPVQVLSPREHRVIPKVRGMLSRLIYTIVTSMRRIFAVSLRHNLLASASRPFKPKKEVSVGQLRGDEKYRQLCQQQSLTPLPLDCIQGDIKPLLQPQPICMQPQTLALRLIGHCAR